MLDFGKVADFNSYLRGVKNREITKKSNEDLSPPYVSEMKPGFLYPSFNTNFKTKEYSKLKTVTCYCVFPFVVICKRK